MQKLSNILGSGNMTPKERILAQVKHYLHLERTGAEILSESDIYALSQGWKPKTQAEVNEYNKYLDGMKTENLMKVDIQFEYLQAQLKLARVSRVLDYAMFSGYKNIKAHDILLSDGLVSEEEITDFLLENSGFNYDSIVVEYPKFKSELDTLIKQNKLIIYTFEDQILDMKRTVSLITGESIMSLPHTHILKTEYKKQLEYYKYFANVFLFIQKSQLFKIYGEILALQDIYKVLLELYDADIGYYLSDLLSELDESIHQLNMEVVYFLSRMEDELYDKHKPKFFLDIQIRKVLFEKPIREYTGNIYRKYIEQFRELFDYEFREKSNTLLH
ncbi:MAG: hypothetical protein KBC41_03370 [Candidatus Pacebacteria bacterium]|nr:hypothetical protein [Candidatus Paceibacterota bacterium]MBP9867088.1 hypothetical protein [Candidatus Paceibacterota bacterium]